MRRALAILTALACSSCLSVEYEHHVILTPISKAQVETLHEGQSDLGECLATMGAPIFVWEQSNGQIALAYAWYDHKDWGVGASFEITRFVSASFDFNSIASKTRGYVFFFDANWKLQRVHYGHLRTLIEQSRRARPAVAE